MINIPSGTGWFLSFLLGYSTTNPLVFKRGVLEKPPFMDDVPIEPLYF